MPIDDLSSQLKQFRELTGLSTERIGQLAGLHSRTVTNVSNAKPGQRFAEETESRLRRAMAEYLRDHVLDVSALLGEVADDDPETDEAIARIAARRKHNR